MQNKFNKFGGKYMQFNKLRIVLISVITFWVYVTGAFAQTNPDWIDPAI